MPATFPAPDDLHRAIQWLRELKPLIEEVAVEGDQRTRLALAFQQLAIEHYAGLIRLCTHGQCSPAFALYRPQFEAFVRGTWFRNCASAVEMETFLAGKLGELGVHKLVRDIEKRKVFEAGLLQRAKDQVYDHLCDLTHGGRSQILARMQGPDIQTAYTPEHTMALLHSSSVASVLSCFEIARALEDWHLLERAGQIHMRIFGWQDQLGAAGPEAG
ncbi:hypothetical protein M4D49_26975 [Cupriavidus pauculus]|nr:MULTISPECIES: hypothetical protein [Burkholderiaceae]MCM3609131.1 hypothetical protein [Cupriavidus pauculus]